MEACRDQLAALFEKSRPLTEQAATALHNLAAASASAAAAVGAVDESLLAALRVLPVVTREERATVFLQVPSSPLLPRTSVPLPPPLL